MPRNKAASQRGGVEQTSDGKYRSHLQLRISGKKCHVRGLARTKASKAEEDLEALRAAAAQKGGSPEEILEAAQLVASSARETEASCAASRSSTPSNKLQEEEPPVYEDDAPPNEQVEVDRLMAATAKELEKEDSNPMQTLEELLAHPFDVNVPIKAGDKGERTLLMEAAFRGHYSAVEELLESGADVNLKQSSGKSALHYAAMKGRVEIAASLLQHGADANACDEEGFHALHSALIFAPTELVGSMRLTLLEGGLKESVQDRRDWHARRVADASEKAYFAKWSCAHQPPPEPGMPCSH
jgi:hypothetical protein